MTDPVSDLAKRVEASSYRKLAAELGAKLGRTFSAAYLCDVVKGRRPAGDDLLKALGYERTIQRKRK